MIFGLLRLLIVGFVLLSIVYVCVSLYSRSARKAKLREWYDEGDQSVPFETYLEDGLKDYEGSLRKKLILGVYVIPLSLVVTIIYFTNFA